MLHTPPPEITASWEPQWVDLGRDTQRRKLWLRMQRDPRVEGSKTLMEFYANRRLVKSAVADGDIFMADIPVKVATHGTQWFLFYDTTPGAGDSWRTNYLVIRRRDLRFQKSGEFEHGDPSSFEKTGRFDEYKLLKYQGDDRFWKLGVDGYKIVEWHWNARRFRFQPLRHWYSPRAPRRLDERWDGPRIRPPLVGTLDDFRPLHPSAYGLPKSIHIQISPSAVRLVTGTPHWDQLHLIQGIKTLAACDVEIGALDPHNPPILTRSKRGLVLTITSCVFRKVRVSKFRLAINPYSVTPIGSWLKPAWTPCDRSR